MSSSIPVAHRSPVSRAAASHPATARDPERQKRGRIVSGRPLARGQ
jgi:hypothetical protein